MTKLILNAEKFMKIVKEGDENKEFKPSKVARQMEIDRSHLFKVLKGKKDPGRKFIEGALKICKDHNFDDLFSLANVVTKIPSKNKKG